MQVQGYESNFVLPARDYCNWLRYPESDARNGCTFVVCGWIELLVRGRKVPMFLIHATKPQWSDYVLPVAKSQSKDANQEHRIRN